MSENIKIPDDQFDEYMRLRKRNEQGGLSRAEYARMLQIEGADEQTIRESVAFIFDGQTDDITIEEDHQP